MSLPPSDYYPDQLLPCPCLINIDLYPPPPPLSLFLALSLSSSPPPNAQYNVDLSGFDIGGALGNIPNVAACQTACQIRDGCLFCETRSYLPPPHPSLARARVQVIRTPLAHVHR